MTSKELDDSIRQFMEQHGAAPTAALGGVMDALAELTADLTVDQKAVFVGGFIFGIRSAISRHRPIEFTDEALRAMCSFISAAFLLKKDQDAFSA